MARLTATWWHECLTSRKFEADPEDEIGQVRGKRRPPLPGQGGRSGTRGGSCRSSSRVRDGESSPDVRGVANESTAYESLLAKHRSAFLDHAASSFAPPENDPRGARGALAQENLKLRPDRSRHALVIRGSEGRTGDVAFEACYDGEGSGRRAEYVRSNADSCVHGSSRAALPRRRLLRQYRSSPEMIREMRSACWRASTRQVSRKHSRPSLLSRAWVSHSY